MRVDAVAGGLGEEARADLGASGGEAEGLKDGGEAGEDVGEGNAEHGGFMVRQGIGAKD